MQLDIIRNQGTDTDLLQDMLTEFKSGFGMVNWNPSGCISDWYRFASGYWYRLDIRIAFRSPTFLNFEPHNLITSPDTSPDVSVFPFTFDTGSWESCQCFFGWYHPFCSACQPTKLSPDKMKLFLQPIREPCVGGKKERCHLKELWSELD